MQPDTAKTAPGADRPRRAGARRRLTAAGFEFGEGGAAVIDSSGARDRLAEVRQRYSPVVGLLADADPDGDGSSSTAWFVVPHAATDLPGAAPHPDPGGGRSRGAAAPRPTTSPRWSS